MVAITEEPEMTTNPAVEQFVKTIKDKFPYGGLVPAPDYRAIRYAIEEMVKRLEIYAHDSSTAWSAFYELFPNTEVPKATPEFWRTPLGFLLAKHFVRIAESHGYVVTQLTAARILGKNPGTIATLAHRRDLDTNDKGKIYLSSVLRRMIRLEGTRVA